MLTEQKILRPIILQYVEELLYLLATNLIEAKDNVKYSI